MASTPIRLGKLVINAHGDPLADFASFAASFRLAADRLVSVLDADCTGAASDVLPALYLYRHALELRLKATVVSLSRLVPDYGEPPAPLKEFLESHNLVALWHKARPLLERTVLFDVGSHHDLLSKIDELVAASNAIDADSQVFRYPVRKDLTPFRGQGRVIDTPHFIKAAATAFDELAALDGHVANEKALATEFSHFLDTLALNDDEREV